MSSRLAVDIGGTFTDVVLETGTISHSIKILTTPDAPERAVLEGVRSILAEAKCRPQDVTLVVHGTTLATNALIERKGARTGLIVTRGMFPIMPTIIAGGKNLKPMRLTRTCSMGASRWRILG